MISLAPRAHHQTVGSALLTPRRPTHAGSSVAVVIALAGHVAVGAVACVVIGGVGATGEVVGPVSSCRVLHGSEDFPCHLLSLGNEGEKRNFDSRRLIQQFNSW